MGTTIDRINRICKGKYRLRKTVRILDRGLDLRRLHLGLTLDVGCGLGRNLYALRGVGVDHNPEAVAVAAANARGLGLGDRALFAAGDCVAGRPRTVLEAVSAGIAAARAAFPRPSSSTAGGGCDDGEERRPPPAAMPVVGRCPTGSISQDSSTKWRRSPSRTSTAPATSVSAATVPAAGTPVDPHPPMDPL